MKSARVSSILAGALLLAGMGSAPTAKEPKNAESHWAQLAQVGRQTDPGSRRDELRKAEGDRPQGAKQSSPETQRRENEVLRRLQEPNQYERQRETPLERQRRESYEAQKQPEPEKERKPLSLSGCIDGYVRREAFAGDQVCVTTETRAQAMRDNIEAPNRRNPLGPHGLDSCIEGYIWREAFPGDRVCVTPETRALTQRDNSEAVNRIPR